jgi:hypothetical protein
MLREKMKKSGLHSYSDFLRLAIQQTTITERCKGLGELLYEVNKIGINLNQLAKQTNQTQLIDQLTLQSIANIERLLRQTIERYQNVD